MATITDSTATEPAFVVERFNVSDGRVEVAGHWRHVRGRRFVRPVLWLQKGESRKRLVAVLDHKPWAADDGEPWLAAFKWEGGKLDVDRAELEVGRELVVELPVPGGRTPKPRPAKPRPPSELDRVREQLLSATKERRTLQAALDAATTRADELGRLRAELDGASEELESAAKARRGLEAALEEARAQVAELTRLRAELDRAREDAEQARADGERLVNDEYRQRERALQAAEEATTRARKSEAAQGLVTRQLTAAREAHAKLEQRLAGANRERDELRTEIASRTPDPDVVAERDRLAGERDEAVAERDRLAAERDELRAELQAREPDPNVVAERDRLRAELEARAADPDVVAERDRLRAELDSRGSDSHVAAQRDRLARERDEARGERDRLAGERDEARGERERLVGERDEARAARDRIVGERDGSWAERDRLASDLAGALRERDQLTADATAARAGRERVEAELVEARADRKHLERELGYMRSERERLDIRRPARFTADSRLAPPRSGIGLWVVRAVALALVAILLAAIVLLVAGVRLTSRRARRAMFSWRSAAAWAAAKMIRPVTSAGNTTPKTPISAIVALAASSRANSSSMPGSLRAPDDRRYLAWIASTASSVSASAAGLSGRWRSTRANRSATPPG